MSLNDAVYGINMWMRKLVRYPQYLHRYSYRSVKNLEFVYNVAPKRINYRVSNQFLENKLGKSTIWGIVDGPWDQQLIPFEQSDIYQTLQERFVRGSDWDSIPMIDERTKRRSDIYDAMYVEMKAEGFDQNYPVEVYIDREGRYILNHGFHRLSLAKILDLTDIPIYVKVRHTNWQEIREAVSREQYAHAERLLDNIGTDLNHPDLRNI